MADLADADNHSLSGQYPARLPVWWGRRGEAGPHPEIVGVSGRRIVMRIEKRFGKFEGMVAKLLKAPKEIRRPLDSMNSLLWELCDGSRSFEEICSHMDSTFNEDIAPVMDRVQSGIMQFKSLNMMTLLDEPLKCKWRVGPGITPRGQTLEESEEDLNLDATPLDGEAN